MASAYGIEGMPDYPIEITGMAEYVEGGIRLIDPLVATAGEVSATVDGFLTFTRGVIGSDLAFTLDGPDLAVLIGAFTKPMIFAAACRCGMMVSVFAR